MSVIQVPQLYSYHSFGQLPLHIGHHKIHSHSATLSPTALLSSCLLYVHITVVCLMCVQIETCERKKKIMWKKLRRFLAKPRYVYERRRRERVPSSSSVSSDGESGVFLSIDSDEETNLIE